MLLSLLWWLIYLHVCKFLHSSNDYFFKLRYVQVNINHYAPTDFESKDREIDIQYQMQMKYKKGIKQA